MQILTKHWHLVATTVGAICVLAALLAEVPPSWWTVAWNAAEACWWQTVLAAVGLVSLIVGGRSGWMAFNRIVRRPFMDATPADRTPTHGGSDLQIDGSQESTSINAKRDWRTTLTTIGSIVSVLLVALGLLYTNDANRKQHQAAVQGQIAERFSSAIDQLGQEGGDKLSIRLGGIYAPGQIMRDSEGDREHVAAVLAAFLPELRPRHRHAGW